MSAGTLSAPASTAAVRTGFSVAQAAPVPAHTSSAETKQAAVLSSAASADPKRVLYCTPDTARTSVVCCLACLPCKNRP